MTENAADFLADQFRPLHRRLEPRKTTIRQVVSVTADIAGNDKVRSLNEARAQILNWLSARVGTLPNEAMEGKNFEHFSPGRFAAGVQIELPKGEYWTTRCDDPDKAVPGRTWTTEISLARKDDVARFGLRLVVATNEQEANYNPSIPSIVRQLAESPGLIRNGRVLSASPIIIDSDELLQRFIDLIYDSKRKNPIFAISLNEQEIEPSTAVIDPYKLALRCIGIAHTVVITGPQAYRLSDILGKSFSVFRGAVRTYRTGMSRDDDPYRHPLAMASQIQEWGNIGPSAFMNTLVWTAARNSNLTVDESRDLPAFTKAKQIALQKQREIALEESDYPALLAIADNELNEKQREIEALESMLSEEEGKLQTAEIRVNDLGASNAFLRSRILELEARALETEKEISIEYPLYYDEIPNWAEKNFSGRVRITARAQRDMKGAEFLDVALVCRCIEYLATIFWRMKTEGGMDLVRSNEETLSALNIKNEPAGADHLLKEQGETFLVQWGTNNQKRLLNMHLKNGGNTRDPSRCLRIYYFWDDDTQQVVIGSLPAHLDTRAT